MELKLRPTPRLRQCRMPARTTVCHIAGGTGNACMLQGNDLWLERRSTTSTASGPPVTIGEAYVCAIFEFAESFTSESLSSREQFWGKATKCVWPIQGAKSGDVCGARTRPEFDLGHLCGKHCSGGVSSEDDVHPAADVPRREPASILPREAHKVV